MSATGDGSSDSETSGRSMMVQGDAQSQPGRMTPDDDSDSCSPAVSDTEAPSNDRHHQDDAKVDGVEEPIYDGTPVSGVVVKSSTISLCCGYDPTLGVLETQTAERVDNPDITVTTWGRFPCLHIALSGLKDTTYYMALDFVEVKGSAGGIFLPLEYSDPCYIPRQNHLQGKQLMSRPRYYNLSAIINGSLETYSCVLKEAGEYVPTVRLIEYLQSLTESSSEVIRLELPASAFIISSEVIQESQNGSPCLKRRILLKLKSDATREREASRNEPTFRSPESSMTLFDNERLVTSMEDMTIRSPPSAALSSSRDLATGVTNLPSRSPSSAAVPYSQHMATDMANMANWSPSPAALSDSRRLHTSMVSMADRLSPPSPAGNGKPLNDASQLASAQIPQEIPNDRGSGQLSGTSRLPTKRAQR